MVRRNRFVVIYIFAALLALSIVLNVLDWFSVSKENPLGSQKWNYDSLFQILKLDDVEQFAVKVEGKSVLKVGKKTVVLMWTKYYKHGGDMLMNMILSGRKWDPSCCSGEDLMVTLDKNMLHEATVVVFYNFWFNLKKKNLPSTRPPGQLWVLFSKESPALSLNLKGYSDMFNWTMTYRLDSDILARYGVTVPLETPIPPNEPALMPGNVTLFKWLSNKSDLIAGVISDCLTQSRREHLVKAFHSEDFPLDIYGACGDQNVCPRKNKSCDHDRFWQELGAKYKFYFAAENSICVDYITEKFWRTLELGMVPLVYGGGNYTAVAPPHSFINVKDFSSANEVADYVKMVGDDPIEYAKYFQWRRDYEIRLVDGWGGWCDLCKLAQQYHDNPEKVDISPNKMYGDISKWWLGAGEGSEKTACRGPPFPLK